MYKKIYQKWKKKNERKKERELTFCVWKMRERERERDHFVCEKISKYIVREGIRKAKK